MKRMPAGRYYLGDPCYVIEGERWDEFLGEFWEVKPRGGIFTFDHFECCAFYTKYGDGTYSTTEGSLLGVDAGMIGLVPLTIITSGHPEQDGTIVSFSAAFECYEQDGLLIFGDIEVDTAGDDEDECPYCGGDCCR